MFLCNFERPVRNKPRVIQHLLHNLTAIKGFLRCCCSFQPASLLSGLLYPGLRCNVAADLGDDPRNRFQLATQFHRHRVDEMKRGRKRWHWLRASSCLIVCCIITSYNSASLCRCHRILTRFPCYLTTTLLLLVVSLAHIPTIAYWNCFYWS